MGQLIILTQKDGDLKLDFDSEGDVAVMDRAKQEFDTRQKQGYVAFRMDPKDPSKGEVINEFDETAEKVMMIPAISGG